jgi:hypothetical protein
MRAIKCTETIDVSYARILYEGRQLRQLHAIGCFPLHLLSLHLLSLHLLSLHFVLVAMG